MVIFHSYVSLPEGTPIAGLKRLTLLNCFPLSKWGCTSSCIWNIPTHIWDYMAQRLQTTDPKWDASLSLLTGVNHPVAPTDDMYQAS